MIILGIDTAMRKTGYGIVEMFSASDANVLDCGVISNGPKLLHSECLRRLSGGIQELVLKFHPDAASIESAFVSRNVRTGMILSLARGAVIQKLAENNVSVFEYSPRSAKLSATGSGSADKQQVASVLAAVFRLNISDIPNDSTDALALAFCHGTFALKCVVGGMLQSPI